MTKNNLAEICILLEEEEEEEMMLLQETIRNSPKGFLLERSKEGCYNILIKRHLLDCEEKFMEYFRVSREIFFKILINIKEDITDTNPRTSLRKLAITAQEKLCLTLR